MNWLHLFSNSSQKIKKDILPNSLCGSSIDPDTKARQRYHKKQNYRPISLKKLMQKSSIYIGSLSYGVKFTIERKARPRLQSVPLTQRVNVASRETAELSATLRGVKNSGIASPSPVWSPRDTEGSWRMARLGGCQFQISGPNRPAPVLVYVRENKIIIFCNMWKLCEIQIPTFLKKASSEHGVGGHLVLYVLSGRFGPLQITATLLSGHRVASALTTTGVLKE